MTARLGVAAPAEPTGDESAVLEQLRERGGRATAFELARALGVTLVELAPTLAWLEAARLAECHAADWRLPRPAKPTTQPTRHGRAPRRARAGET